MITDYLDLKSQRNCCENNSLGTGPQCPLCTVLWLTDSRTHSEVPTFFIDEESSRGGKEVDELPYWLAFYMDLSLFPLEGHLLNDKLTTTMTSANFFFGLSAVCPSITTLCAADFIHHLSSSSSLFFISGDSPSL